MPTIVHTVKKGENLDKIAKSYGIANFNKIYSDLVNAKFRKTRPDPNKIEPGDKVIIPDYALTPSKRRDLKSLIQTVEARIKSLQALKADQIKTTAELVGEITGAQRGFKKTSSAVDAASTLISLLGSLGKITAIGMKNTGNVASEIAKSNKAVLDEVAGMRLTALSPALQSVAQSMGKSSKKAVVVVGITADSFFKMQSPSFWGKTLLKAKNEGMIKLLVAGKFGDSWSAWSKSVNWDPEKEFEAMKSAMQKQSSEIEKQLAVLIEDQKKLLASLKAVEGL